MKTKNYNRLFKRKLEKYLGKDFDVLSLDSRLINLFDDVSLSYDAFFEENKFLEHIIDTNSADLEKANEKIREQNSNLQQLLEKTSDENQAMIYLLKQYKEAIDASLIVSTTSKEGIINYVNDNFVNLSGYSKEELIGYSHNIVRHPDTPKELFSDMWQTIKNKKIWQGTLPNRAKDGSTYYVDATVAPLLNMDGDIVEFMALRKDVTKAIEYQKNLEEQKYRVSQILDNQESIVMLLDEEVGVVEVNKKFYEVFGFKSFEEFKNIHNCICELFEEKEEFLRPSNEDVHWVEPILREPQKTHLAMIKGNIYSVKVSVVEIDSKHTYLATFMDITDIEEARAKSKEAELTKANFLANMSHEIRTPMNAILGFSELVAKTELNSKQSKYVDLIRNSTSMLIQIINDILDYSKLESKKTISEYLEINPFLEFEDTFMLFVQRAREKQISYMIDIDSSIGECIKVDAFHIKQVMTNLISNAIKFTPSGGTVHIKIAKVDYKIRFSVQDSGIGIAKEKQEKIFEPFAQADDSTTRKFGGTGLGLSISNSLVTLMNSKLMLESREGYGSKFYFDIELTSCSTKNRLKDHLVPFSIYLFALNESVVPKISKQLQGYDIAYKILDFYDESLDRDNVVIISQDEQKAKKYKSAKIVFIGCADDCGDDRCHHLDMYDDFPSILYNELMRLNIIDTNFKNSQKRLDLKLLIAEDYDINRILVSELLDKFKIEYEFALNGQEAINMAKNGVYDLILMDVNMPILNGMDATIAIREFDKDIPIIALTANALDGDRERFLSCGMNDYLTKPIDIKAFEAVLVKYSKNIENNEQVISLNVQEALEISSKKMGLPQKIVYKVFDSFVSSLDKIYDDICDGINEADFAKILINAHNLKGAASSLYFDEISKISSEIENAARVGDKNFDYLQKIEEIKPYLKIIKEFKVSLS